MSMNSKLLKTILLIVAIVLLIAAGYLFLTKKIGQKNVSTEEGASNTLPTNEAKETKTSDWKTYRNEKYGFEFKRQSSLLVSEINGTGKPRFVAEFKKDEDPLGAAESVGVIVYDNFKNLNTEEFLNFLEENKNWKKWSSELQLNGLEAIKIDGRPSVGIHTGTEYENTDIYLKNATFIYVIFYNRIKGLNSLENVFKDILSTFKFTE